MTDRPGFGPDEQMINTAGLAEWLRTSVRSIQRRRQHGEDLPPEHLIFGKRMYKVGEVRRWIEQQPGGGA